MIERTSESISFETIINQEPLILIDSGIYAKSNEDWYEDGIYEAKRYSQLDTEILYSALLRLEKLENLLLEPNVKTIPKVIDEFIYIRDKLKEKLRNLNAHEKGIPKKYKDEPKLKECHEAVEYKKRILEDICFLFHNVQRIAKRSESLFIPQDKIKFYHLEKIVIATAEITEAKIDFSSRYHSFRKKEEDLHTDEQLVAAALYLSIFDNLRSCILTSDSDIQRILKRTYNYLTSSLVSSNGQIARALKENPINVYFETGPETAGCRVDTCRLVTNKFDFYNYHLKEIHDQNNGELKAIFSN